VTSSIFVSVYEVIDLKYKPIKLCVTYKIKIFLNKVKNYNVVKE